MAFAWRSSKSNLLGNLLPDNLDQYPFIALSVKFSVKLCS